MGNRKRGNGIQIDLRGPNGNAFVLLGTARKLGRQLGLGREQVDKISNEMAAGTYEELLAVFEKYFKNHVTLIR
ncbi:MAG: hypothetical protein WAX69_23295 [Victivallales bacterium]